jgi:hypothetical protein
MSMEVCKQAFALALPRSFIRGIGDLTTVRLPGPGSGVYIIHGIAVRSPRPRLNGTSPFNRHPSGGGLQFEAK